MDLHYLYHTYIKHECGYSITLILYMQGQKITGFFSLQSVGNESNYVYFHKEKQWSVMHGSVESSLQYFRTF